MDSKNHNEDTLTAIELVLREFLNPDVVGRWFSCRERSIGNIMRQVGLNQHYSTSIYNELKRIGMIEKEGERSLIRYKIITSVIPDTHQTAIRIMDAYNESIRLAKNSNSDCRQTRRKSKTMDDIEREATILKSGSKKMKKLPRIPHLGERVYVVDNSLINEAIITCVKYDEEQEEMTVVVDYKLPKSGVLSPTRNKVQLKDIYFDVDTLISHLQRNIVKFEK